MSQRNLSAPTTISTEGCSAVWRRAQLRLRGDNGCSEAPLVNPVVPHDRTVVRLCVIGGDDICELLCIDFAKADALRRGLPSLDALSGAAESAKALSDPTRLRLALALRDGQQMCVCDLAWVSERQDKLVSHHLRQLRAAGIALAQRRPNGSVLLDRPRPRAARSRHGRSRRGHAMRTPATNVQALVGRAPRIGRETYRRLASRAKRLSWPSVACMTLGAQIAILARTAAH